MTDQTEYMTDSDEPTEDHPEDPETEPVPNFGLITQRQTYVEDNFGSEEMLLGYLESGRELSDLDGIGGVTEARILQYVEREHPEVYEAYESRRDYRLFNGDVYTPGAGPAADVPDYYK